MNAEKNPLSKFYRSVAISVPIPSRGLYYEDGTVEMNSDGEVAIYPMTAQDELMLQNPDALLSGEAVISVIKSCVPGIKHPKKLLSCDIDVLMIAIRVASYGDTASMDSKCPKCFHSNTFSLNLDTLLNHSEKLEDSYEIVVQDELTVFVTPGRFENTVKQQKAAFQNTKLEQAITNPDLTDEQRMKILSQVFAQVSKVNYELILDSIDKVVFTDEEGELVEIKSKNHIGDWLKNIDKHTIGAIEDKLIEVNRIGIEKTLTATCEECEHVWETNIEFNPVNFS